MYEFVNPSNNKPILYIYVCITHTHTHTYIHTYTHTLCVSPERRQSVASIIGASTRPRRPSCKIKSNQTG
jgi:hypothetical protein